MSIAALLLICLAILYKTELTAAAFDEPDPANDAGCPSTFPGFTGSCSFNSGISCSYNAQPCLADTVYTNFCRCVESDSAFALSCLSADFDCGQSTVAVAIPVAVPSPPATNTVTTTTISSSSSTTSQMTPNDSVGVETNANPNDPSCPLRRPDFGDGCEMGTTCRYDPFACPGGDPFFLTSCNCEDVGFVCFSAGVACPSPALPPPPRTGNPNNSRLCPLQSPLGGGDACSQSSLSCEYDLADCPGVDLYTTTCDCDANVGKFVCAQALVTTCPEPELLTTAGGCPQQPPDFGENCAGLSAKQCNYFPFSCETLSNPFFTTRCECDEQDTFVCIVLSTFCPPPNDGETANTCPMQHPTDGDMCDDTNMICNYDPFGCPEDSTPKFLSTCACVKDGSNQSRGTFVCNTVSPDECFPSPPPPSPPSSSIFCFSGDSIVNVQGKGNIQMNTLKIGDKVHVGNDKYEPIYSFAHHAPQTLGDYLMIQTTESQHDHLNLKLSESHMILTSSGKHLPASNIMIGDEIVNGHGKNMIVESIKSVKSMGVFAPLTPSGKIVVNNVSASSFVAFGNDWGWKMKIVGGYEIGFSFHWMCHSFEFPHRLLCYYLGECVDEEYDEEGISMIWSSLPFGLMKWVMNLGLWLQYLSFVLTLMMVTCFWLMETMMVKSPLMVACACCLAVARGGRRKCNR